mgnify:CR=1 FL=1
MSFTRFLLDCLSIKKASDTWICLKDEDHGVDLMKRFKEFSVWLPYADSYSVERLVNRMLDLRELSKITSLIDRILLILCLKVKKRWRSLLES